MLTIPHTERFDLLLTYPQSRQTCQCRFYAFYLVFTAQYCSKTF